VQLGCDFGWVRGADGCRVGLRVGFWVAAQNFLNL